MTTIKDINLLIAKMKSTAIETHRMKVATLSHKIVEHPSDYSIQAQLQTSLQRLDFLMSA